jgi:hypothetical protein
MILSSLATTEALDRFHTPVPHVAAALGAMSLFAGLLWTFSLLRSGAAIPAPAPTAVAEVGQA